MLYAVISLGLALGIAVTILCGIEIGRWLGRRRTKSVALEGDVPPRAAPPEPAALEGAVFGLMGLLLAFTFSGAISRWESRRQLAVDETNALGTAWMRLDLLPESAQAPIRSSFRAYLDARIATYRKSTEIAEAYALHDRAVALQLEIWNAVVAATRDSAPTPDEMLLLPALNQVFDLAASRIAMTRAHPPTVIFILLGGLILASSIVAGRSLATGNTRNRTGTLIFTIAFAATVFVILEMEYPRVGLVRIDSVDDMLVALRDSLR